MYVIPSLGYKLWPYYIGFDLPNWKKDYMVWLLTTFGILYLITLSYQVI